MKGIFIETPQFSRLLPDYLTDESYRALQQALLANPDLGDVMPDTGGFRKLRWPDRRRGKGARGGLRIVYYWLAMDSEFWMFTIYGKDEMTDLAPAEKKMLKVAIKAQLERRKQR